MQNKQNTPFREFSFMSNIPKPPTITRSQLQQALTAVDDRVLLILPRLLRRIIRSDRDVGGFFSSVPHQNGYCLSRERLLDVVAPAELRLDSADDVPELAVLLPEPTETELDSQPGEIVLCRYWRLLFHLRVHEEYEAQLSKAGKTFVRERIHRIGRSAFDEISAVLRQENALLPPRTDHGAYVEFAAVYWELKFFAPNELSRYFPALPSSGVIEAMLKRDGDTAALFDTTRPSGAAEPESVFGNGDQTRISELTAHEPLPPAPESRSQFRRYEKRSGHASQVGNNVRAAVWWMHASQVATPEQRPDSLNQARNELVCLADRLHAALQLSEPDHETLRETLPELLDESAQSGWSMERRFLYDLQKICLYHEQNIYKLHPFRWFFTFGKKPLKEPLPLQRQVLIAKYLRAALHRVAIVRIGSLERKRLSQVLKDVVRSREHDLRAELRPVFIDALKNVGLIPDDHPETVARDKLIEEWLDVLCERGQLNMGDVRDGLSRNQMKMADLAGPSEFLWGDALLRLDAVFAQKLRGVYRAGEFYLRWLQRFSSLAFGTSLGRFLTRYVALPFGGAFVVLFFAYEVAEKVSHAFGAELIDSDLSQTEKAGVVKRFLLFGSFALGSLFLALFYIRDFRGQLAGGTLKIWQWTRYVFFDIPAKLFALPWIYQLLHSRLMLRFYRYAFWPLLLGAAVWAVMAVTGVERHSSLASGAGVFVVTALILNSLLWRRVEDHFTEWSSHHWLRFRTNILPGLARWVIDLFRWFLDLVNRALYAIDELMRFRQGQSRLALLLKSVFGVVWGAVAYVVRFCIVLLIEPQINPIKHFPVVTVSHKLILPFSYTFAQLLAVALPQFHEPAAALPLAVLILSGIPGIFGFLVWELKENWKLYSASRPVYLPKASVGHHGESMVRLLRPGFHSGTIPKLLTKRRSAEQKARKNGDWQPVHKYDESIHHVEESIRRFLERELVHLLNTTAQWQQKVRIGKIHLAFLSVGFDLHCDDTSEEPMRISLEEQSRWLVARILQHGWLSKLPKSDIQVVQKALAGVYQMAGVRLIRGQMESVLSADEYSIDITRNGLVVWRNDVEAEAFYDIDHGPRLRPTVSAGGRNLFPSPTKRSLVFSENYLTWSEWVDLWDGERGVKEIEMSHVETERR